jgi:hypothetical protein
LTFATAGMKEEKGPPCLSHRGGQSRFSILEPSPRGNKPSTSSFDAPSSRDKMSEATAITPRAVSPGRWPLPRLFVPIISTTVADGTVEGHSPFCSRHSKCCV